MLYREVRYAHPDPDTQHARSSKLQFKSVDVGETQYAIKFSSLRRVCIL